MMARHQCVCDDVNTYVSVHKCMCVSTYIRTSGVILVVSVCVARFGELASRNSVRQRCAKPRSWPRVSLFEHTFALSQHTEYILIHSCRRPVFAYNSLYTLRSVCANANNPKCTLALNCALLEDRECANISRAHTQKVNIFIRARLYQRTGRRRRDASCIIYRALHT